MQRFKLEAPSALVDETLDDLFALVASGAFPHTADEADCRFCDFRSICGDVAAAAARAASEERLRNGPTRCSSRMRAILRRGV